MVKYLKSGEDFGPQHFSRDFGFKNSAEDRHDARNHPSGTEDDEYGDGSYVEKRRHGGRIRRAMGGPVQEPTLPTGAPGTPQPPGPAAGAANPMAHATITMPLSDAAQGAARLIQSGRQVGARQTMGALAQAARRAPQAPAAPAAAGLAHGGRAPKFNPGGEKGKLHREMHIPEGETIPAGRLESAAHSDNPEVRRDAIRAQTMKKWHHGSR